MSAALASRPLRWPTKDPSDKLDYSLDWSGFLEADGEGEPDTIVSADWTVPAGLTKGATIPAYPKTVIWLSGGLAGTEYPITCEIKTAAGREIERTVLLYVAEL